MRRLNTLFAAAIFISLSSAGIAAPRHQLNLPGGRLGDAIVALGRQAGISIGLSDPALASQAVSPVKGSLTVEQALGRLLRGKSARYIVIDPETIRVVRQPTRRRLSPPAPVTRPKPPPPPHPSPVLPPPFEEEQEEIIVTAAKRQVPMSSYPGAVTIVDGDDTALRDGIHGSEALVARLPSLSSTHLGPGRNKLFIRGMADSSFNGPTQATVGQYLGEMRLNYNAPDPDLRLYDMDRVEVLSGPQGTLYGAASIGGIIRAVPNVPHLRTAETRASVGLSSTLHGSPGMDVSGTWNVPLVDDRMGLRLVGYAASEGGYIDDTERRLNNINRTRVIGGRAALRSDQGSGWIVDLGVTAQRIRGEDAQYADREGTRLSRRSVVKQDFGNNYLLANVAATKEWDDLRFITSAGFVRQTLRERFDSSQDGFRLTPERPYVVDQANRVTLLSAESRVSRQGLTGAGWLFGMHLVANRYEQRRSIGPPDATFPITGIRNNIIEGSLFGEASAPLFRDVIATAGGRITYSHLSGAVLDPLSGSGPIALPGGTKQTRTALLPTASLMAQPASDLLIF